MTKFRTLLFAFCLITIALEINSVNADWAVFTNAGDGDPLTEDASFCGGSVVALITQTAAIGNVGSSPAAAAPGFQSDPNLSGNNWFTPGDPPLFVNRLSLFLRNPAGNGYTYNLSFNRPVNNLHKSFFNIDGAQWDYSATTDVSGNPVNFVRVSGNNEFEVNAATNIVNVNTRGARNRGCQLNNGDNPSAGCGTIVFPGSYQEITASGTNPSGGDGHSVLFYLPSDQGDAPDGLYGMGSSDEPVHCGVDDSPMLMLGTTVDFEATGIPQSNAEGDDNDNFDDEDGVVEFQSYQAAGDMRCTGSNGTYVTAENEYCVVVKATNNSARPAQLVSWLDFDVDGSFSDAERSVTNPANTHPDDDGTFTTGNVPANSATNDYVLIWTDLGDVETQSPNRTFARIRITTDTASGFFDDNSPQPTGGAMDGEVEDYVISTGTLPVTLSHFSSEREGDKVSFDWGTSSELFNVGFQLWGLDGVDGDWEKLHNWYVRSGSGNAVEPQSYSKRVRIPGSIDQLMSVGLSSIDSDGSEHYYGPFEVGSSYGELSSLSPIDWGDVRAELDTRMGLQGYVRDGVKGYRQVTSGVESNDLDAQLVVEFQVSESGMYRISSGECMSSDDLGQLVLKIKRDYPIISLA